MKAKFLRSILFLTLIAALLVPAGAASAQQGRGNARGLDKHDRELLAQARAEGKDTVTLLVAAENGAANSVASAIQSLGGRVRRVDNDVAYVRAVVPVDQAEAVAKLPGVVAVDVDEVIPLILPPVDEEAGTGDAADVAPPDEGTPALNPYMPTQDTGAPQFVAQYPTYDGRGVVVGVVDTGIDLLTPELQSALSQDGQPVRKFTDWVTMTDPFDDGDPTWLNMENLVQVSGGTFAFEGVTYTAAADGEYRFATFAEVTLGLSADAEYAGDLNRDGDTDDVFGVLWAPDAGNVVFVDTNQNLSFADEAAMTDYKVNYDTGLFGVDDPDTDVRESVPFVVQTDGQNKFVNIGIVSGSHGTHVAGIIAGKDFFGGEFDGAAPNAQLASVRACLFEAGCTYAAMTEGMIYLAKQANVDVINMSIGGLPALNDGNNARAILYNRLVDQFDVQMFFSAGNSGPGINTVGDPAVSARVMAVGAYATQASYLANYGNVVPQAEQMQYYSSRGPSEAGGFKPDIVAPGSAVSTVPAWQEGQPVAGTYALPPGYAMYNGTSMASPQAAGGAALLISAAKQAGVQHKPDQLRQAIKSAARFIGTAQAYEQGSGLLNVGAAWDLLKTNIKTETILSRAPVDTIIAQYLETPGVGTGIYLREGLSAGDSRDLSIRFVRTTGGAKAITYNLTWVGNDGTFSSANKVALGLNKGVDLKVTVNAQAAGVHSALLYLDNPATTGIDYMVMNTVIATTRFAAPSYSVTVDGSAPRADKFTTFFYVPAGTPAFKVDVTDIVGRVRVARQHPYGLPLEAPGYQTGGTVSRVVQNPTPGVWEVTVDASRASPVETATFKVTGSILGASISPSPWVIPSAQIGVPVSGSFTFTNLYGAFTGNAVGSALGSAFAARPTIDNLDQHQQVIAVPAGSTNLTVRIGNTSDAGADLDLYVFYCGPSGGSCAQAGQSADGDSEEAVSINNPPAGYYLALVDAYSVPNGKTEYDYVDAFSHPSFGAVNVTDAPALRSIGAVWTSPATVTANAAPASGRFLLGYVRVVADGAVIGSAEVHVLSVAP